MNEFRFSYLPQVVDLEPFGLKNDTPDGAVYFASDRPYGLIEATVPLSMEGAEEEIQDTSTDDSDDMSAHADGEEEETH